MVVRPLPAAERIRNETEPRGAASAGNETATASARKGPGAKGPRP